MDSKCLSSDYKTDSYHKSGLQWPCYLRTCLSPDWKDADVCAQFWDTAQSACESLSYTQFVSYCNCIATVLRTELDLSSEHCIVGILWRPHILTSVAVHSVVTAGLAFFPVDYDSPVGLQLLEEQLVAVICLCSIESLPFLNSNFTPFTPENRHGIFAREDWCLLLRNQLRHHHIPNICSTSCWNERLAYVVTTSGTSGKASKVVFVADSCLTANIAHLASRFGDQTQGSVLLAAPLTFDPSFVQIYFALSCHHCLVIPRYGLLCKPGSLLSLCVTANVSWLQCTPSLFMLESVRNRKKLLALPKLNIILGGEPFPLQFIVSNLRSIRSSVYTIYGVTEVSSWATLGCIYSSLSNSQLNEDIKCDCIPPLQGATPIGFPMLATTIQFSVPDAQIHAHELVLFRIYGGFAVLDSPSNNLDAAAFQAMIQKLPSAAPWATGDLVLHGSCGRCLWYVGRRDRVVKRLGRRVCLEQLENIMTTFRLPYFAVRFCKCELKCINHSRKILTAFVGLTPKKFRGTRCFAKMSPEKIRALLLHYLRKNFHPSPSAWLPDRIVFYRNYSPLSAHGKLACHLRHSLTRPVSLSVRISRLWQEATGMKIGSFSADSDFLSSGGSSLDAVIFIERLINEFPSLSSFREKLLSLVFSSDFSHLADFVKLHFLCTRTNTTDLSPSCNTSDGATTELHVDGITCSPGTTDYEIFTKGGSVLCAFTPSTPLTIKPVWRRYLGKCVDASVVITSVANGLSTSPIVYVGSHSGSLASLCLQTGDLLWSANLGGRIEASAAYGMFPSNPAVTVGTLDGMLCAVDPLVGSPLWTFNTGGSIKAAPTVLDDANLIVCGSHGRRVYAIDHRISTKPAWVNEFDGSPLVSPICILWKGSSLSSSLLIASLGGMVGCMDVRNADKLIWSNRGIAPIFSKPTVCPITKRVVVAAVDGKVRAYFPELGTLEWIIDQLPSGVSSYNLFHDPLILPDSRHVVLSTNSGFMFCADTLSGAVPWKQECTQNLSEGDPSYLTTASFLHSGCSSAGSIQGMLVITRADGSIFISTLPEMSAEFRSHPADICSSYRLPSRCFSAPVLFPVDSGPDFWLLCGCRDDNVHCLRISPASKAGN
ncbi:unnamed protein product [Calicophoron daubneyi]|uniref:Acyl-CoA synthetase family member 4 n=1 Tax=Calicophoron daubneyi TaxID=300641 RepID=A0AAV2TTI9_CALDB